MLENIDWVKVLSSLGPVASYISLGLLVTFVAWWRWRNKVDNESIIISLNTPLCDETFSLGIPNSLRMYTLLNCQLKEIIENRYAQKKFSRQEKRQQKRIHLFLLKKIRWQL